jgi:hypothetical protein
MVLPHTTHRFGPFGFVASVLAAVWLLDAGYMIFIDVFGDAARYSNRSLARAAMGLAVVLVTYCAARFRSQRLWLRIAAWPFAVVVSYLAFGAALLGISLLIRAIS